jgi:hypothetical protein
LAAITDRVSDAVGAIDAAAASGNNPGAENDGTARRTPACMPCEPP